MNREEYTKYLEYQNGCCECPAIAPLFTQMKKTEGLEGKCEFLKRNVDLEDPRPEDLGILVDYRQSVGLLETEAINYSRALNTLFIQGLLKAKQHDLVRFTPARYLSPQQARDLLTEDGAILTIHCSSCEQQIDIVSN